MSGFSSWPQQRIIVNEADAPTAPPAVRGIRLASPWAALVVVLFCLPLFFGLGRTDLGNDESIYSFAVDEILASGNWLTPKCSPREDIPFLEKPPLKFWIVAAPIRLGLLPHDEFGLRFWDAVFGSLAFLYVFAIGFVLAGPLCGVTAVFILFAQGPLLFDHGLRSNNMEAALVLAYCGGIYHFLSWRRSQGKRRHAHLAAVTMYFVLGFMTKYMAACFLPVVLVSTALLFRADRNRVAAEWRALAIAGITAISLIAPWFIYQYSQVGSELWEVMFAAHVYQRFTAYVDPAHLHPWHYYLSHLYGELVRTGSMPAVAAGTLLILNRALRHRSFEAVLVLLWFAVPVALISLGTSKLYHYMYPFLPPIALAGGYAVASFAGFAWPRVHRAGQSMERRLSRAVAASVPGASAMLRSRPVQVLLLSLVGISAALAAATWLFGPLQQSLGGYVTLRNSSMLRPLLVALAIAVAAGRLSSATRVAFVLVVLAALPAQAYRQSLWRLPSEDHTLRSMSECLRAAAVHVGGENARPGVYAELPEALRLHFLSYYFRRVGPWVLGDWSSDETLYRSLHVPSAQRPVLTWPARYVEFSGRLTGLHSELAGRYATAALTRGTAPTPGVSSLTYPVVVELGHGIILVLPGHYGICGLSSGRPGGAW
jgi:4-amino-4-deoxy-L-arabinose transferase-like glycosyltransferase